MYGEALWKSIKNLKFSVFIPDVYLMCIELILAFLFLKLTGMDTLFLNPNFISAGMEEKLPALGLYVSNNLLTLLLYFAVFALTSFILGASLNAMRFGMIRDIVLGNRYSFKQVINYGVRFWPIVVVRFVIFLSGVVTFLFLLGCYTILNTYCSAAVTFIVVTALGIIAVLFLKLLFIFTYAVMFLQKKGALASVRYSFFYFFRNKGYTLKVFFVLIIFSFFLIPFELVFMHYQRVLGLMGFYTLLFLVVRNLTSMIYLVWSEVFVFYSYEAKELSP